MSRRCRFCSPRDCREGHLYVVVDGRDGSFKIGNTVQRPSQRLKGYRSNGCDFFSLAHQRRAGCEWTSADREERALKRLRLVADNFRGDWFRGDVRDAIAAVELVCAGVLNG